MFENSIQLAAVENPFSSSNSSIGSSTGSISTINSSASLVKQHPGSGDLLTGVDSISGRKYEFSSGVASQSPHSNLSSYSPTLGTSKTLSSSGIAGQTSLSGLGVGNLAADTAATTQGDSNDNNQQPSSSTGANAQKAAKFGQKSREIYCRLVCLFLWLNVFRLGAGLLVEKSLFTLDFYYMGSTKMTFLIPALCLAIQVAAVSSIFIRNNEETNWLVPFYSSKDYLIRSRSNFRPRMKDYTRRVNISVSLALMLAAISALSLSAYLIHCAFQSDAFRTMYGMSLSSTAAASQSTSGSGSLMTQQNNNVITSPVGSVTMERIALLLLLLNNILWSIYSTFICFLVSFYFNLICSIMKARFHYISKIIEDLAESNTRKTTNQARKITTLYLEHNEACELLDESNDFWQYLILFTYFTYIPAYCYCLYNLFFVDFAPWPCFITWVIHTHMGFIILLISFSAAGVSTEVSIVQTGKSGLFLSISFYCGRKRALLILQVGPFLSRQRSLFVG